MMKILFPIALAAIHTLTISAELFSQPPSHMQWDALLKKHVSEDGAVDYKGFIRDSSDLNAYLQELASNHPDDSWKQEEQLAYWINAYNAFTVKLIIDNYPVESIKDIKKGIPLVNSVWDIKFIELGDETYDLNNIEHSILRKDFQEPRIHFAINCASVSCPVLLNEAYTADKLEVQLAQQTRQFLNDPDKNQISSNSIRISKIFSWFKGDFTENGSLIEFINTNGGFDVEEKADVDYLDYDWSLND